MHRTRYNILASTRQVIPSEQIHILELNIVSRIHLAALQGSSFCRTNTSSEVLKHYIRHMDQTCTQCSIVSIVLIYQGSSVCVTNVEV